MNDSDETGVEPRRDFLRTAALLPIALALGCSRDASAAEIDAVIRRFILAVGPWGEDRRAEAEDFATRFLAAAITTPLRADANTAIPLGDQPPFRDAPMAVPQLDLSDRTEAEKKLLTDLVIAIYGSLEVHYLHLGGAPNVGVPAGREQYTRAPSEWTAPYRRTR